MVNLETGVMERKERGHVETKKRAPAVHFRGSQIKRPCSSWERVRRNAGLPDYVTPHILRHSRATTMLKAGVAPWETANALGMSLQVLISTYGHHHPDWQKDAANAR